MPSATTILLSLCGFMEKLKCFKVCTEMLLAKADKRKKANRDKRREAMFFPGLITLVRAGLWEAVVGGAASRTGSGGTDTVSGMRVRSGQWEGVAGNATRKISIWIQRWLGRGRPTRALWLAVGTRD
uniref:Uncharacterized protein n=1 Tax=Leersia perrieri TaxID=77586 RepID=A0A0D9UYX9_9ORYZ